MALHLTPMRSNMLPPRPATANPARRTATGTPAAGSAANPPSTKQNSPASSAGSNSATSFQSLLGATSQSTAPAAHAAAAADPAPADTVPTPESAFGANPWLATPIGSGPNGIFYYNNIYFATPAAAAQVAQMVGGRVVERNMFSGDNSGNPYQQQQANEMVQLPSGALINPGLVASFYTHGYSQATINQMIAQEVANTPPPNAG